MINKNAGGISWQGLDQGFTCTTAKYGIKSMVQ
jgi:hypothetical protein